MVSEPDLTIRRRIVTATLSNYAGRMISLVAWFALTPLMIRRLGPTEYGLWVLIGSLVAYSWLLGAGIHSAITRYVAASHASGDERTARRAVATSVWCDALLGLVAIALSAALAPV